MKKFTSPVVSRSGLNKGQKTAARTISRFPNKSDTGGIIWMNWHGKYSRIIKALNRVAVYHTIFARFIKQQDNVFITPSDGGYFGMAPEERGKNGYTIYIGNHGFIVNGQLVADPTFIAKVVMHEGLHSRYHMARAEGKLAAYPTVYRHYKIQEKTRNYEGDHQAMAEGNVDTLVQGMIQFDSVYGLSHSKDWYIAIAWWGSLTRATSNWKNMPASVKDKYIRIQQNEQAYMAFLTAKANFLTDKNELNKSEYNTRKMRVDWSLYTSTRTS